MQAAAEPVCCDAVDKHGGLHLVLSGVGLYAA